jgi:hypothetical protein
MNYNAQAARDYLIYDRVEDWFEVLDGKGHPALVDPQSGIIVSNSTELEIIFVDGTIKLWFNL